MGRGLSACLTPRSQGTAPQPGSLPLPGCPVQDGPRLQADRGAREEGRGMQVPGFWKCLGTE